MESSPRSPPLLILLLCLLFHSLVSATAAAAAQTDEGRKLYIVYMGEKQHEDPAVVTALHHDVLASVVGSKKAALESLVYSYRHGFSGFAAKLTRTEVERVAASPGVLRVSLSRKVKLHTTRSWDFLALDLDHQKELLQWSNWGTDSIIGIIDTGIWPEAKSFNDEGYGPIPDRWKGQCTPGQGFDASSCNRKIIGARWYAGGVEEEYLKEDYLSARDTNGHGTHTASTSAGSFIQDANYNGLASGQARGGAPRARIAVYKALWGKGGHGSDAGVLAAVDDAVHDGVDVLSLSLGPDSPFEGDSSFATVHAVAKNVTVVYSGGNNGPRPQSVANLAPWVITVAATTMDRSFPTTITLGNNQTLVGQALYYGQEQQSAFQEIVFGSSCDDDTFNGTDVKGKIVFCHTGSRPPKNQFLLAATNVVGAGARGIIFAQYTTNYLEEPHQVCEYVPCNGHIPFVLVDLIVGTKIATYIRGASAPVVKINHTITVVGSEVYAPKVAAFSSRGPNVLIPGVIKPDIAAPGVSILAANRDHFVFKSGTSMAVPHISGIVALLRSMHPDWSPAAIKSAMMTTASTTDEYKMPIKAEGVPRKIADPFDYGGGQVNPNKAANPGLVYDVDPADYKDYYHCSMFETDLICSSTQKPAYNLNLPSISIPDLKTSTKVERIVKNVGEVEAIYHASLEPPPGIKMEVEPMVLVFNRQVSAHKFMVKFTITRKVQGDYTFGSLTWSNDKHSVRIPIAVQTIIEEYYADVS